MAELDTQTVKLLAEGAARAAAEEVAKNMREEIRTGFTSLEDRLLKNMESALERYFGDMKPSDHIVEHSRIERLMSWADEAQKGFWKGAIATVSKWVVGIVAAGLIAYSAAHFGTPALVK